MKSIKISIPTPCHENWAAMTPLEKGRFCGSCQKQVMDFTMATDREIFAAVKKDNTLCGRFNDSQLNRELTFRENATKKWLAVSAVFLGLIALSAKANAQKASAPKTYVSVSTPKKTPHLPPIKISGTVTDTLFTPLANTFVAIKGTSNTTLTDSTGAFFIKAKKGDILVISTLGFKNKEIVLNATTTIDIVLEYDEGVCVTGYGTVKRTSIVGGGISVISTSTLKRKSFFGRLIQKIVNTFKKHE